MTTLSGRTTGLRWLKSVLPLSETSLLIISVIPRVSFAVTIYKSNFSAKYKMVTGILFTLPLINYNHTSLFKSYNRIRTRTSLLGHGLFIFSPVEDCLVLRIKTLAIQKSNYIPCITFCYEIWDFSNSGFPDWISKAGTYQMFLLKSNIEFGFQFRNFVTF